MTVLKNKIKQTYTPEKWGGEQREEVKSPLSFCSEGKQGLDASTTYKH